MKSIKLAKALTNGRVLVRTGKRVMGQVVLKFRTNEVPDRLIMPYPLQDTTRDESFINLSKLYSSEQLLNSNLENLILNNDLELR